MRKNVIVLAMMTLAMISCTDTATLDIENDTSGYMYAVVDGDTSDYDAGDIVTTEWELASSIFSSETAEGNVDVWGFFVFKDQYSYSIDAGSSETITVTADGGAVGIENNSSSFYIDEVYISLSSSSSWGNNLVSYSIYPGETAYWTLSPGEWDIKVVDDWDDEFVNMGEIIFADELSIFGYTGFLKVVPGMGKVGIGNDSGQIESRGRSLSGK
jgi:hypothetical protein